MGKMSLRSDTKADKEYEAYNLLKLFVNTGDASLQNQIDELWSSLPKNAQKNIKERVALDCLAFTRSNCIGEALDHSNEIIISATIAMITAGVGAYYATGNPVTAVGSAVITGIGTGMLMFSSYQNKSIYEDSLKRQRLSHLMP